MGILWHAITEKSYCSLHQRQIAFFDVSNLPLEFIIIAFVLYFSFSDSPICFHYVILFCHLYKC